MQACQNLITGRFDESVNIIGLKKRRQSNHIGKSKIWFRFRKKKEEKKNVYLGLRTEKRKTSRNFNFHSFERDTYFGSRVRQRHSKRTSFDVSKAAIAGRVANYMNFSHESRFFFFFSGKNFGRPKTRKVRYKTKNWKVDEKEKGERWLTDNFMRTNSLKFSG